MNAILLKRSYVSSVLLLSLLVYTSAAQAQSSSPANPAEDIGNAVKGLFGFIENAISSITNQTSGKLRTLTEEGKFEEAAAYYLSNEKELAGTESAKSQLPRIAEGLNARLAAGAHETAEKISAIQSPLPHAEWSSVKSQLSAAESLLARYDAQPLLRRETLRAPAINRLSSVLADTRKRLTEAAPDSFAGYDHAGYPLFFKDYPVNIDDPVQARIAADNFEVWLRSASGASETRARELISAYSGHISDPDRRARMGRAYSDAYSREKGLPATPNASQTLQLSRAVQSIIPGAAPVSGSKTMLVIAQSADARPGYGQLDMQKLGLSVMQVAIGKMTELSQDLTRKQGYSSVIIAVPTNVKVVEAYRALKIMQSQRTVGTREEPNPEYQAAQDEARRLQDEFSNLERQNQDLQNQAQSLAQQSRGSGFGMFGAMLGSTMGTVAIESQRTAMQQAQRKAQSTPQMISRPVTQAYSYPVVSIEKTARQQVALYVIDGKEGRFRKSVVTRSERRQADIAHHVDSQDSRKNAIESSNALGRSRIEEMDRISNIITPEQIIEEVDRISANPQSLTGLDATIRDDIRKFQIESDLQDRRDSQTSREIERQLASAVPPPAQMSPSAPAQGQFSQGGYAPAANTGSGAAGAGSGGGTNCPRDLSSQSGRIRYAEMRTPQIMNEPFTEMIRKAGSVDRAIAAALAQKKEYENTRDTSKRGALQVASNPGAIETPCPRPEGTYCSLNYAYHIAKDAILLTQATIDAFTCYKSAGLR